ncbi:DUF4870 domain-containing protein [Planosporangium sp. 12N6]|uniref:DUF4870 domain-containing protein n=1 Tax=Planosporangium spinosum TaxID=3402278 RepID=UPI003CEDD910
MTEPPRPPGEGTGIPPDPTAPQPPSASTPGEATAPSYPPPPSGGYAPPPPPGGYPPPPPGGYAPPPAGGYQPGPGVPPPGYASNDDKTWALVAHFGGAAGMFVSGGLLGFVAPLIAYLAKGQQSPAVRAHAVAALNFQILWSILGFVAWIIGCFLLFLPTLAVMAIGVIFGVIAGVKANEGELYRYPMSAGFIK